MPCTDGGVPYPDDSQERLDAATRAACEMAKLLKRKDLLSKLSRQTQIWIRKHDRLDRERALAERRERQQQERVKRAIAKLSREDREALGISA